MVGRRGGNSETDQLWERVARWRAEHGGRGVRWPAELWTAVVAAANVEGIGPTARRLGIAPDRLAARMARPHREMVGEKSPSPASEFVEVDTRRLSQRSASGAILRFEARDGKKLEIELHAGNALDLVTLVQAFWRSGG